ncbi:hypothetical protein BC938DRAFT_471079 [Jimgerdemannia flammicorona]|uniref:Uncharacterized protein n=1 Tax=Jimgerdemannia flammicorona TaxID=994334 RepID=A0A433Q8U4_9FUNG|nr:hypothetical protein BC938DRAFT_471079 [Jimgerdemannia flammicorona]
MGDNSQRRHDPFRFPNPFYPSNYANIVPLSLSPFTEIGQALLHRHETLVKEHDNTLIENEETKASFQRQLASKKQEIQSLQQLAEHMGLANRELQEDRDRANLKALTIDLETTQARLTNAVAESEARGNEIDKLGVFKIMVKAGMEKEEGLRTKVNFVEG